MTTTRTPTPRIIGYQIGRKVDQDEIPSTVPDKARDLVGMLGFDGASYMVAPGVDVLELGVIANPGNFLLLPLNAYKEPLWKETVTLIVTPEQAAVQRNINARFFAALLAELPHDAADLEAGVASLSERGRVHPIFDAIRRAALETWAQERRVDAPLDDAERRRLDAAVARRTIAWLRGKAPRCRLDRQSLRPIVEKHFGSHWAHILASVAEGDYEDATLRVLARAKIGRGLKMPMSCIIQVLPGVERLDIFFGMLRWVCEPAVPALDAWLKRGTLGSEPETAELAVRVLFAMFQLTDDLVEAKALMRMHVPGIQHEPVSADARLVKLYLATVPKVDGSYDVPEEDQHLFDGIEGVMDRWERAFLTTIDEIIVSLPERAADAPGSG